MKDLFELTEIADKNLKCNKIINEDIVLGLKDIVISGEYIGVAQINSKIGDIEYNSKKIINYIKFAENIGLEALIFPEFSLIGSPLFDITSRHPIIISECYKWLNRIAKYTVNIIAFIGFIEAASDGKYISSVAILHKGKIQKIVKNSSDVSERLYENYILSVGDDYKFDNYDNLLSHKPNVLINCASYNYKSNRNLIKNNVLPNISKKLDIPCIFVNQVGANDNILYDGISCVYNSNGELIARAKSFEEQFMIVNPIKNAGKIYPLPNDFDSYVSDNNSFTLNYEADLERTYKALMLGIKDYFNKCGFKRAVLGLSGGLDSSVCAVLLADALGKENVYGVSMPSFITSVESISDAEKLAKNLGINYIESPICSMINATTETFNELFKHIEIKWDDRYKNSYTSDNIQARSRAMILWGISNEFPNCIPIATSDKSEAYMGYATINGDMSGGFAPIADITKTKLFALARWLNNNRCEKYVIPENIILKKPGAELAINPETGKPLNAEDALMPYEFLDEVIWRIENLNQTYNEILNSKFIYENKINVTKEQKSEWLNKFYRRMSTSFYKWSIMPPYVAIEKHSINKCDYIQPITSSGINYKGVSEEYINECLN